MKVVENYSQYKKEKPNYAPWKNDRNIQEAKRLAYIEQNKITPQDKNSDIQRAEAILNCIDVMDEFSQTRAEDMEIVTDQGKTIITEIGMYATMGLGVAYLFLSKSAESIIKQIKNKNFKSAPKLILPAILISIPMFAGIIGGSLWGAGKEIKASKLGRAEAINTKLSSPKQFAELTDEQEQQVEEIASTIYLSPKEAKKLSNANKGFGIFKSMKTMFSNNQKELETINNISLKIRNDQQCFDKIELTAKEIEEAKRDKQLIQNIVEKIDIASQDYAEDVELVTSTLTTTLFAGSALTGWVTNKILSKIPNLAKHSKLIAIAVALVLGFGTAVPCAKVQKQASRVGRFKVKQDFLNNPKKLIYVDDDKAKELDGTKYLSNDKKPGFFKFLSKVFKENKEYNNYLKTEYLESQKRSIAREQIEITPEQEKRAKQLQMNTFKMFNKLDEKSQSFSESVEAIGEIITNCVTTIIEFAGIAITGILIAKKPTANPSLKVFIPALASIGIAIPLSVHITKEQKRASKVANMLALNDLDDYRNFVDYSDKDIEINQSRANLPK